MNVTPNEAFVNSREQRRCLAVHPWDRNAPRATMESCYQHADDAGVLAVVTEPTKCV